MNRGGVLEDNEKRLGGVITVPLVNAREYTRLHEAGDTVKVIGLVTAVGLPIA